MTPAESVVSSTGAVSTDVSLSAFAKAQWRLVPFLVFIYALGFMDRVNVSYAQLAMKDKLGFSDEMYGLGAGILFIGYFLFEIPSNLYLARNGARRTIGLIMVLWGIASTLTAYATTPGMFYFARFMVGTFESGLFPGIVLYLSYWFPTAHQSRIMSLFLTAMLIGSAVTGPLSGWILQNWDGVGGYANYQWLFIIEGLPSILFGVVTWIILIDRPSQAPWLTAAEKQAIADHLAADERKKAATDASPRNPLRDPRTYLLAFGLFAVLCGYYAITFWLPSIIRDNGIANMFDLGLIAIIPNVLAGIAMIANARHSDRTMERGWHFAIPLLIAAVGLTLSVVQNSSIVISLTAISAALAGIMCCFPTFWAIVSTYLPARSAPLGIALINTFAATGGFVSPYTVGYIKTATGSMLYSFAPIIVVMVASAIVILTCIPREVLRGRQT